MTTPTTLADIERMKEEGDAEYLKDFSFGAGEKVSSKYFNRRRLSVSTWPARWLGSICSRSRYHVIRHLPDVVGLTFRTRCPNGTKNEAKGNYLLRLNGTKDLCVIAASQWERQIHFLRNPGPIISTLHSLRNIGIDLETLVDDRVRRRHSGPSTCLCDDPEIPADVDWPLGGVASTLRADLEDHVGWPSPCTFGCQLDPFMSFVTELPNIESLVFTATSQPLDAYTLQEWEQDMTTRQRFKWSQAKLLRDIFLQPNEVYGSLERTREPDDNVPYEPISDGQQAYVMYEMYRNQPEDILPQGFRFINAHYNEYFPYAEIATKIRFRAMRPFDAGRDFDFNRWRRFYRYEIDHDGNVAEGAPQPKYSWWARQQVWPTGQSVFPDGSTYPEEAFRLPEDLNWDDLVDESDDESDGSDVDVVMAGANGDMNVVFDGDGGNIMGSEDDSTISSEDSDGDVEMGGTDPDNISLDVSYDIINAVSHDMDETEDVVDQAIMHSVIFDLNDMARQFTQQTAPEVAQHASNDAGAADDASDGEHNDESVDALGDPRFDVPCIFHLVDWHPTCG